MTRVEQRRQLSAAHLEPLDYRRMARDEAVELDIDALGDCDDSRL